MDVDTVVTGIQNERKRLAGRWGNPSIIGDAATKMATYNAVIGDALGDLESQRETKFAQTYLDGLNQDMSATAADNRARAKVSELTAQVKKLKLLHDDTWKLVSMIQSRLRGLENESRNQT